MAVRTAEKNWKNANNKKQLKGQLTQNRTIFTLLFTNSQAILSVFDFQSYNQKNVLGLLLANVSILISVESTLCWFWLFWV